MSEFFEGWWVVGGGWWVVGGEWRVVVVGVFGKK
jgi:hypothetical protein